VKKYVVLFTKIGAKELRHLPNEEIKRVSAKSKELESNPRPAGCIN